MSKRNPYTVAEKVLRGVGNALLYVFTSAAVLFVIYLLVSAVWPYWGAWALTSPVLFLVGYVLVVGTGVALCNFAGDVADKWSNARYEWDRKKKETK